LHVPLTGETRSLISARELALMKPTAILVNTARGAVVDTDALMNALSNNTIAGAGLDVTDPEPMRGNHPILKLSNAVVLPHIGSAGIQTRINMFELAVRNVVSVLNADTPQHALVKPKA
jgi:phosphoglycerate dehydrogenase-like enzyme